MRFFKPDLLKKSIALGVFLIVVLLLIIPLITLVSQGFQELRQHAIGQGFQVPRQHAVGQASQQTGQQAVGKPLTFTPTVIPLSAPEIGNPWRGPVYYSNESPPPNWPLIDHYNRWCWSEIEPTEGQYNLDPIEEVLADAKAHGGKGGFTIMPVNTSGETGSCLPPYLRSRIGEPPDWNNPLYLSRLQALITAISQKYANDPRFGWVDIFAYGNWNEWNLSELSNPTIGTPATKQAIINMNVRAFPHQRLVLGIAGYRGDGSTYDALSYALNLSPKIGIRMNCLGYHTMGGAAEDFAALPLAQDRWKTAPNIVEYCSGPSFQAAQNQIKQYHFALIGDGAHNINSFSSYSASDQYLMLQNYKTSGYRFVLDSLTIPSQIGAGGGFTVITKWSNVNVTPAYNPWNIMLQLRSGSGAVVWQGKSQLDLQTLLPTNTSGTDTPRTATDAFHLPKAVPNGSYKVAIQIVDPDHYYAPLNLAIQGRQTDGSYILGTVHVSESLGSTVRLTPQPSPMPTNYGLPKVIDQSQPFKSRRRVSL